MQEPEPAPGVTPAGVRSGAPAALAALVERRGAGVLAYAREVCEAAEARLAAAEALARFRAAVVASGDAVDLDPERLLLSATRHASAAHARPPAEPGGARRMLGRTQTDTCARMPSLIVARAENLLGDADLDRLSRHLERCASCRATEAAFRRAERAYVATSHASLDADTAAFFVTALTEAAPVEAQAAEPAPAEPASAEPAPAEPEPAEGEPGEPAPAEPAPAEPAPAEPAPAEAGVTEPEPEPAAADAPPAHADDLAHLPDELDDPDEDGWTGEDDAVAVEETYGHHMLEPGPATWNATEEPPRRRRRLRIVLPVAVLAIGAAAALAIAGVFDGGGGTSSVDTRTVQSTSVPPPTSTAKQKTARKQATNPATVTAEP